MINVIEKLYASAYYVSDGMQVFKNSYMIDTDIKVVYFVMELVSEKDHRPRIHVWLCFPHFKININRRVYFNEVWRYDRKN